MSYQSNVFGTGSSAIQPSTISPKKTSRAIPIRNCYNYAIWPRGPGPLLMTDVTQILSQIEHGVPDAAGQLLPLVYDELRKLAASKLAQEKPGQTLQATALVHEAYLRLVGSEPPQQWDNRWHFFAAAAEVMRRITLNRGDTKRLKRGAKRAIPVASPQMEYTDTNANRSCGNRVLSPGTLLHPPSSCSLLRPRTLLARRKRSGLMARRPDAICNSHAWGSCGVQL